MIRRAARAVAAAAALSALGGLAGCAGDTVTIAQPERRTAAPQDDGAALGPQYVALGDSYAAAPGVPETSGAGGCFRSSGNYAQAVAEATGLSVTDATCSGATTETVLRDQVPVITPAAELVTVGVGGNDSDLFTTLLQRCLGLADADPSGTPCSDAISPEVEDILPRTEEAVGTLFDAIAGAAPDDARIVVVGYPDLLPTTGSCPDLVPLAAGDYPLLNEVTHRLSDLLQEQAEQRGFDFVDLRGPSRGHDICSAEPWVNGAQVAEDGTIPFHPFAAEQQAVAALVSALL